MVNVCVYLSELTPWKCIYWQSLLIMIDEYLITIKYLKYNIWIHIFGLIRSYAANIYSW